jgi:hypothetical protein
MKNDQHPPVICRVSRPGPLLSAEVPASATGSSNLKGPRHPRTSRRTRSGGHKPMRDGGSPPLRSPIGLPTALDYHAVVA